MRVTGYKFSKRKNSTLQPTDGTELNVNLKDNTSFHSPSFLLAYNKIGDFNYLKWEDRYYFITDQIQVRHQLIELVCEMDYLATYKDNIRATTAFVNYATSSYNKWIADSRLSTEPQLTVKESQAYSTFKTSPCYFISYASNSDTNAGIVYNINEVVRELNTDNALNSIFNNPSSALSKRLNNVNECITQCLYLPIEPVYTQSSTKLTLANYATNIVVFRPRRDTGITFDVSIPWIYTDFRNCSAYTTILILLPGYGFVNLNADNFIGKSTFNVTITFDGFTGELAYLLDNKYKYVCNISSPYRINTINGGSMLNTVSNVVGTTASLASGHLVSAIDSTFNAIRNGLEVNSTGVGSYGGVANWYNTGSSIKLWCLAHNTTIEPSTMATLYGRPLNEVRRLSSLLGYVQTVDASVSTGDDRANDIINGLLNGGVYLE